MTQSQSLDPRGGVAPVSASQLIGEARQRIPEVTPAEVRVGLEGGQIGLVLDVREPDEWANGHIPGAVHAPRGLLEWYADPAAAPARGEITRHRDGRVVVTCASGARSLLAAQTLAQLGYADVASMSGGYTEWTRLGFPTE